MSKDFTTLEIGAVKSVESDRDGAGNFLRIMSGNGNEVRLYMPGPFADAMVDAWGVACDEQVEAEERYWTTREPDDRYTMDGLRRQMAEARALK